jgi:anaerobic selenocysteine-containing dehydrogenase
MTTRRRFLQVLATTSVGAVAFTGCQPPRPELQAQSRVRLAEDVVSAYENWYATTCRQCDAGCGVVARVIEGRAKKLEGNPDHPLNRGKLCARGQAAVQEQYHPDRLQGPLRQSGERGSGRFVPISWDEALSELAVRLNELQRGGRGGELAMLTRPLRAHQALVVERFAGALGARWLGLEPLSEAPLRAAVRRVFGSEILPTFDIQNARSTTGSSSASSARAATRSTDSSPEPTSRAAIWSRSSRASRRPRRAPTSGCQSDPVARACLR